MLGITASNYPRRSLSFVQRLHLDKIKQVLDRILHHHKTYMDEFFLLIFFQKKNALHDYRDRWVWWRIPRYKMGPWDKFWWSSISLFFLMISQREKNTFIIQQLMSWLGTHDHHLNKYKSTWHTVTVFFFFLMIFPVIQTAFSFPIFVLIVNL